MGETNFLLKRVLAGLNCGLGPGSVDLIKCVEYNSPTQIIGFGIKFLFKKVIKIQSVNFLYLAQFLGRLV